MSGWINKISEGLEKALSAIRPPLEISVPPIMMLCEIMNKPGMSAIALTAAILKDLANNGFDIGPNPDGSPNMHTQEIYILASNFIDHIQKNAVVSSVVPNASMAITGTGENAGGPVEIIGHNIGYLKFNGGVH